MIVTGARVNIMPISITHTLVFWHKARRWVPVILRVTN